MTPNTKGAIAVGITLGLVGLAYYLLVARKKGEVLCADMLVDGFVYNADKSQAYAKKAGEWAGCNVKDSQYPEYWSALNTKGVEILLKKSEVKTRKQSK